MKDSVSSTVTVIFEAFDEMPKALTDFLDAYFDVSALNYIGKKEQYVGYADLSFDEKKFKKAAQTAKVRLPKYKVEVLKNKNWLTENVIKFDPLEVADFCVYGIDQKKKPQTKKIPVQVYAATAFGSTHQTTQMCLTAISDLFKILPSPKRILDVGTGSGILSVAAAKKFKKSKPYILGVDIDRESINVAAQNAFDNGVQELFDVSYSDGFKAKIVKESAPYDIVFANILARPLISMAKDMSASLKPNGYAVLSGFTDEQTDWVLSVYEKAGFKLVQTYQKEHWRAVLLQKKEKLSDLQARLKSGEAFLIKRDNMFLGEDILEVENKILELTGFSGSAGMMLVTKNKIFLLVDGRYSIQARKQVSNAVQVVDSQSFWADLLALFKKNHLKVLICNPWALSVRDAAFLKKENVSLKLDFSAPMSSLKKAQKVFKHPIRFAGLSSKEKCAQIVRAMPKKFDALLLCSAEEVSWLSNMRAVDLPDTPVLRAFGLLLKNGSLKIYAFDKIKNLIKDLKKCKHVIVNQAQTPLALLSEISNAEDIGFDVLTKTKLQKNDVELKGFKNAHIRDDVAMVRFLCWLEKNSEGLSELDIVQKLHDFRAEGKYYFSESFGTIAAINQNGAIVHYQPTLKTNKKLGKNALLLIDSGAQYFDGTTDITRTVAIGKVKDEIKKDFTLVLKADIALSSHVFKEGTKANELDFVCRNVLLTQGKDYKHGTGHSVGHFSNVHEAPFAINMKNTTPVLAHYITSIEPGYYKENAYGIRIENLVYTAPADKKGYLCFEPLTLCPIDLGLILPDMLTKAEKDWLNAYHARVFKTLNPYLNANEKRFLKHACRAF